MPEIAGGGGGGGGLIPPSGHRIPANTQEEEEEEVYSGCTSEVQDGVLPDLSPSPCVGAMLLSINTIQLLV